VTVERIRDKFAAAKAKGMWTVGVVPLGHRVENRQLLIAPAEAATVRRIFAKFVETRSTAEVVRWLRREGITCRTGCAFTRNALTRLALSVVQAIPAGKQPRTQSRIWLKNHELPQAWDEQGMLFGEFDAGSVATAPNELPRASP